MTDAPRTLRLKPKSEAAQKIRRGFPWVYQNELVLDRRSKAIPAGSIVLLEDTDRTPLAKVAVNTGSKITARVLSLDCDVVVDAEWVAGKITTALSLRERLYDAPFYRLVHAEGDGLPGLIIDRFGDTAVVQPNAAWTDLHLDQIVSALVEKVGITTVWMNGTGRARVLEGLEVETKLLHGPAPTGPIPVPMNGATYFADIVGGQKTGLFFDQRPNHAFVQGLVSGQRVLDVFCHVGGFGLAALAAGASDVEFVDASQAALDLVRQGAGTRDVTCHKGDAFDALQRLQSNSESFDVVICDPPAFAPHKAALEQGLRAYEKTARLSASLVPNGGYLVLCSCSHAATLEKFRASCLRGIGRAGRQGQLIYTGAAGPDHPVHPSLAETGYLKALVFRLTS